MNVGTGIGVEVGVFVEIAVGSLAQAAMKTIPRTRACSHKAEYIEDECK